MKSEYQIALIGVSESGKTCYLVGLGRSPQVNQSNVTCEHVIATGLNSSADRVQGQSDPISQRISGNLHIQMAMEKLSEGEFPDPTASTMERARVGYMLTTPERGQFKVELQDYAGERHDLADTELDTFRQDLFSCDGAIVLIPSPPKELSPNSDEFKEYLNLLSKMKNALQLLLVGNKAQKFNAPIAIVFTKTDLTWQYTRIPNSHDHALTEFKEHLKNQFHQDVRLGIEEVIKKIEHVSSNTPKQFACSAFGKLDRDNKLKSNAKGATSYYLAEPLLTLVDQIDQKHKEVAVNTKEASAIKRIMLAAILLLGIAAIGSWTMNTGLPILTSPDFYNVELSEINFSTPFLKKWKGYKVELSIEIRYLDENERFIDSYSFDLGEKEIVPYLKIGSQAKIARKIKDKSIKSYKIITKMNYNPKIGFSEKIVSECALFTSTGDFIRSMGTELPCGGRHGISLTVK